MSAVQLDDREISTILAALRTYQAMRDGAPEGIENIATDGGRHEAMDDGDIDALCERLNTPTGTWR